MDKRFAAIAAALFCLLMLYGYFHVLDLHSGLIAYPLACIGLIWALDSIRIPLSKATSKLFGVGLMLSFATWMRPELIVASAVLFLTLCYLRHQESLIKPGLILLIGYAPTFLMLAHNVYFGNTWALLTTAVDIDANLHSGPSIYWAAMQAIFSFDWESPAIQTVTTQWSAWLWGSSSVGGFIILGLLFTLLIKKQLNLTWVEVRTRIVRIIEMPHVVVALFLAFLHAILLMYHPSGRYALLAFSLNYLLATTLCSALFFTKENVLELPPIIKTLKTILWKKLSTKISN